MPTSYTTLLGLALPVQGELQGTWGDEVNNYITSYLDASVAGTQTLTTDADVTLTKTTGTALGATSSQYLILNCTGSRGAARNITAPAASKAYVVINATTGGFAVTLRGAGPTTGVSIANGERAVCAWNGSDFVKVASSAISGLTGILPAANGGTGVDNSTRTLTISTNGGTLSFGGASTTMTFPTTSQTLAGLALAQTWTAAQTFRAASAVRVEAASTQDAIVLAGRAGGTSSRAITLTPATLSSSTTLTLPNVTDTVATVGTAQTFTAAQTFRAANAIRSEAASTQDAVVLAGRAGGTGSFAVTLTPTTLSASRTLTLPDNTGTVLTTGATVAVSNGGTGQTSYINGELLIGNTTGNTLTKATLTAGTGITITNGAGSITITASSSGGAQDYIVQSYGIV